MTCTATHTPAPRPALSGGHGEGKQILGGRQSDQGSATPVGRAAGIGHGGASLGKVGVVMGIGQP